SGVNYGNGSVMGAFMDIGLSVGYDDDFLALKMLVQSLFESLWSPYASLRLGFFLGRDTFYQLADVPQYRLKLWSMAAVFEQPSELIAPATPGKPCSNDGNNRSRHG